MHKILNRIVVVLIAMCAATTAVRSQTTNDIVTVDALKSLLVGMGYEPEIRRTTVTIKDGNYVVNFSYYPENEFLSTYETYFFMPNKVGRAPWREMLLYNDGHKIYFSMGMRADGAGSVSINESHSARNVSPASLRRWIADIETVDREQQPLFNPANWK